MTSRLFKAAVGLAAYSYIDAKYGLYNDLRIGRGALASDLDIKRREAAGKVSLHEIFLETVATQPDNTAVIFADRSWTWKQAQEEVNRLANYLLGLGLKPGDRVAVFLNNSAQYTFLWQACMAINVAPAFINNSLTGKGLVHCIGTSEAPLVIYEPATEGPISEVQSELSSHTNVQKFLSLDDGTRHSGETATVPPQIPNAIYCGPSELSRQSTKPVNPSLRKDVNLATTCALIYTSGTTGLPKAALCSHGRVGQATNFWSKTCKFSPEDRIYTSMPIYHSSAAFLCVGVSWRSGSTIIIGRRFSASRFWDDVRKADATVVQYIGEIARYLLAVPASNKDTEHRVRLAYGNGMRPDVWMKFRERFNVPDVFEFYASSEGNGALFNYNTGPFGAGAVGRMGPLAYKVRPDFRIVRVDPITEDVVRDESGMCVICGPDEPGEFVMKIRTDKASGQFQGYAGNPEATKKKILTNVMEHGDSWFRSGDLLRRDADGFFWFGDRMGDTFRWRSENVSTAEVAAVLGEKIAEANVYGVLVPNHDGRAGCAAIPTTAAKNVDLVALAAHARKSLPKYSVPLFLRIVPAMESTGTAKQLKVALRNQGIDHAQCGSDPLYWLPPGSKSYVPFQPDDLSAIKAGKVKL